MESNQSRREFFKKSTALGIAGLGITAMASGLERVASMEEFNLASMFALPPLPYSLDALEPHIDAATMDVHYNKHHQAYVYNLNEACEAGKINATLDEIMHAA